MSPMTTESPTIAQILDEAADIIVENGWYGGAGSSYSDDDGKHRCASTAIGEAVKRHVRYLDDYGLSMDAREFFAKTLGLGIPGSASPLQAIYKWNDAHVIPEPVVAALHNAAVEWRYIHA